MAVLVLSFLGLVMIYTASAPRLEAEGLSQSSQLVRQGVFVAGGLVVFAFIVVIVNLIVDLTYSLFDPKVKYE